MWKIIAPLTSGWEDVEKPDIGVNITTAYEPLNSTCAYPGLRQGYSRPTAEVIDMVIPLSRCSSSLCRYAVVSYRCLLKRVPQRDASSASG